MNAAGPINPLWFIVLAIVVAAVPIFIGLLTSYVKVSIVLGMVRNALGTQQVPSTLVVTALSLALTGYTMSPIIEKSMGLASEVKFDTIKNPQNLAAFKAFFPAFDPWREFLERHAGKREIAVLSNISMTAPASATETATPEIVIPTEVKPGSVSLQVLIPAFVLTELKEGFAMAFVLLLPFLVIDLIVANILVGLGMSMVSPAMISLPLKMVLFVVSDGWLLLAKGLIQSYAG